MKLINLLFFYLLVFVSMVMVLNDNFNRYSIIGICLMIVLAMFLKTCNKNEIYELLGIAWLQKKFKNNKVIMEMTKE